MTLNLAHRLVLEFSVRTSSNSLPPDLRAKKKKKKQRLNPGKLTLIRVKALQPDDYDVMFFCKELRKTYKTSSG